ncbi:MAG: S-methyl-5-thioribose kinase [Caldilineaceae bacterium]|nr:S-methyl-5-thioribose kinase [Caldilineaceae bacterium]
MTIHKDNPDGLDEAQAIDHVRNSDLMTTLFDEDDQLEAVSLTEGNINLIYRVYSSQDPMGKSVLIKQALPHAWRYPEFKLPRDRARVEWEMLEMEASYCPENVPRLYFFDAENSVMGIEDLNRHTVMRTGMMDQAVYPKVARHVGRFMARTLFYTSDFYLSSGEKKALQSRFINPVMVKLQEDLVFTQPYIDHPDNRWTPELEAQARAVQNDAALRCEAFQLKERYMTHHQALLHNDFHTGSIMLNADETKVIDPEFAFYGPMGHDIGSYFAHLVIGYAAQEFHAKDADVRTDYRNWIIASLHETWMTFAAEFMQLWEDEGNDGWPSAEFRRWYVDQLLQESAGFGATEIMRRTIGVAHVDDFVQISDSLTRATAESLALNVARRWLMERRGFTSIDDLINVVLAAEPTL